MRAGGVRALVQVHLEAHRVPVLAEQARDALGVEEPGVAAPYERVARYLVILPRHLGELYAGEVAEAGYLLEVQLPAHGGVPVRAEDAPDAVAHGALAHEAREGVLEYPRRREGGVGEIALRIRALLERGAEGVVGVGQEAGAEEDPALAVIVDSAEREAVLRDYAHGRVGLHAHAAVEALELGELAVGLIERIEVARYVLDLPQIRADLGVLHVIGVLRNLGEALRAEELGREEVVEAVGAVHGPAVPGEGHDGLAGLAGEIGAHYALVEVQDVIARELYTGGYVRRLRLEAEHERLLEARERVAPALRPGGAVVDYGGAQAVIPVRERDLGQVVLPDADAAGEQGYDKRADERAGEDSLHGAPPHKNTAYFTTPGSAMQRAALV